MIVVPQLLIVQINEHNESYMCVLKYQMHTEFQDLILSGASDAISQIHKSIRLLRC
jgi:hypothetical protein